MAKAKAKAEKKDTSYRYILASSNKLGMKFKKWCASEGLSINRGLNLLMKQASNGTFKLKQTIRKKKVKS